MAPLLKPEKPIDGGSLPFSPDAEFHQMPDSLAEKRNLQDIEAALQSVLITLDMALPEVLSAIQKAQWEGEALCDPESLAALIQTVDALKKQLLDVLDPPFREISHRLETIER